MRSFLIQNKLTLVFPLVDQDGAVISNLATASNVFFMIKNKKTDPDAQAVVSKSIGSGVTIDSPVTGSVTVVIDSPDTDGITPKTYYFALQINYTVNNIQEVYLTEGGKALDTITFSQDIIRNNT